MATISTTTYASPYGQMVLGEYKGRICLCDWRYRKMRSAIDQRLSVILQAGFQKNETDLLQQCIGQLEQYFKGQRKSFDLPMQMLGTDFQKSVWKRLQQIPYGRTLSYIELARELDNEDAVRAVAAANGANALALLIPCHRVVGKNGSMTGYAGGIRVKKQLLELEQNRGVQMELF